MHPDQQLGLGTLPNSSRNAAATDYVVLLLSTHGDLFRESKRLLEGVDVDAKDKSGRTILSRAAEADYPALVQLLDNATLWEPSRDL